MNKSEYLLQSFGLSAQCLQDGINVQVSKHVAVKIKELSKRGDISCLIDIANKLLIVVEDTKFSPIWVMLLDGLSHFSHQENVQAIYRQLMEKQARICTTGSLARDILHKLWLSHLPCLESAIMTLVEHICSDEYLPHTAMIQESLMKSFLVEIASREQVIYQTVYRMLMSLIISSDFSAVIVDITANFCCMVRHGKTQLSFQNQLWNTVVLRRNTGSLESLLKSHGDPQTMSSTSVVNTLCKMHQLWTNDKQKTEGWPESSTSIYSASETAIDQKFEELWCLTVEYRNWITVTLNVILSCDEQFVEQCLWFIAAHHQINLSSQKLKDVVMNPNPRLIFWPLEDLLTCFVKGLREHLHTSFQLSEQASQIKMLAAKTCQTLQSKTAQLVEQKAHQRTAASSRNVVNQILMTFFFQSDGGLSIADELLILVTSSKDAFVHVRCLIYHYYLLNVTTQEWNSVKCDWFLSLLTGLQLRLEKENTGNKIPDFVHLHKELQTICPVS